MVTYDNIFLQSKYSSICHKINDVYIPFDSTWKNIGITLSGGADSAILSYMLCKFINDNEIKCNVHVITNIRMWKLRPWQSAISKEVYNYFVSKFPQINFTRHENFVPPSLEWGSVGPTIIDEDGILTSGDIIELKSFGEYIGHYYKLDAGFLAVNKNPSIHIDNSLVERDVLLENLTIENFIKPRNTMLVCHPFRILEKHDIIKLYYQNNVVDLLEITRSCEGDDKSYPEVFNGLDYTNYTPGQHVPVCNQCFWCKERQWGIDNAKE